MVAHAGARRFSVYDEARGLDDERIIQKALAEDRILITNDKDFGERSIVSVVDTRASFFFVWLTTVPLARFKFSTSCF